MKRVKRKLVMGLLLLSAGAYGQSPSGCYYVAPLIRGWGYIVTFDARGGSAVPAQEVGYSGKAAPPRKPTLLDYTFGGWYREPECRTAWDFATDVVTADITLHARWVCVVTLNGMGGSLSVKESKLWVTPGEAAAYPAAIPTHRNPNRVFDGWYADECRATPYDFSQPVVRDVMIYAKWR